MSDVSVIPRRRRNEDAELDITPMIDITFLLLAFFVVMSKMDPKKNVTLPVSEVAANNPEKDCVIIYVDYEGDSTDGDANVFIGPGGDQLLSGTSEEIGNQITEYVNEAFIQKPELDYILIKANGDAKNGLIERVKTAAVRAAAAKDKQLLIGVENKKSRR